jgi:hypothetical protein
MDLNWFFEEWLYRAGYLNLQYAWSVRDLGINRQEINIVNEQIQGEGNLFKMPIDLRVTFNDGTQDTTLWIEAERNFFTFRVPSRPVSIEIDPDGWVLLESERIPWNHLRSEATPDQYRLCPNFPNPFNETTWIDYNIPDLKTPLTVTLSIYNLSGQKVRTLLKRKHAQGCYRIDWDGRNDHGTSLPSGIYIIELSTEIWTKRSKAILIK